MCVLPLCLNPKIAKSVEDRVERLLLELHVPDTAYSEKATNDSEATSRYTYIW